MSPHDKPASAQILEFTVEQPELLAALTFAGKAIPKRTNVPVLTGVVLTSDGQSVTVEAFDYDQARRVALPGATCNLPGRMLVAAEKLTTRVKALPKDRPVTLTGEGTRVRLSNGKTTYTIPTMPIEDYPARPGMPPTVGMIGGAVLAGQVAQVAKFACTDETLPNLTGIRLSAADGGRLSLEATDRFRLAVRDVDWAPAVDTFAALVPGKLLAEVTKVLGKTPDAVVTLGYDTDREVGAMFGLETDHVRVVMRTLDGGNYPPMRSLIPEHAVLDVDVDAAALVEAIKRVEVAAERSTAVVLRFADGGLILECGTADDGGASEAFDGCSFVTMSDADRAAAAKMSAKAAEAAARKLHARDPKELRDDRVAEAGRRVREDFERDTGMTLGVNPSYLRDVLDLGAARVRMRLVSPVKPFVIVPLAVDGTPIAGVTNLLMTIRIAGGPEKPQEQPAPQAVGAASVTEPKPDAANRTDNGSGATAGAPQARTTGAPAVAAEAASPVTAAAPAVSGAVLSANEPHLFRREVEDGKKPNPFTKCTCGLIRNAKIHGGKSAAAMAAAAAQAAGQAAPTPTVPQGPIWMTVLQLAGRIEGRMVTEATEEGARKAVEQFSRALDVLVSADDNGKRMYVATRSQKDADLMQRVACAFGIPAHTAQGVWPPQGTPDGNEPNGADGRASEQSPVIVDGEPTFDPRATSVEAFTKVGTGDFEGALALIRTAMQVAPEHRFHDKATSRVYGWAEIERAILAKQVESEINADAERDALAAVTAASPGTTADADSGPDAGDGESDVEADEPQVPATVVGDDTGRPGVLGSASNTVIVRLREALAGQPDDVIEAAVAAAMTKMQAKPVAATSARPRKAAATKTPPITKSSPPVPVPSLAGAKRFPAPVGDVARWEAFGMLAPSTIAGERVFVLPAGTRLRALRKAVMDALGEAKRAGTIAATPSVDTDKTERPYRLRVRFTEPGALTAVSALVDDTVAAALPDVLPVRAAA